MATTNEEPENNLPRLELYWYETKDGEEGGAWWGQLAGSTHRLQVVAEELESICTEGEISVALSRLEYHVENYFNRAYELRERAIDLLGELIGQRSAVKKLKDPKERQATISDLQLSKSPLSELAIRIIDLLDDDVGLRNQHAHEKTLSFGLYDGKDICDPHDALIELENDPDARKRLEELLRNEIKRVAELYEGKVEALCKITWDFLEKADSLIRHSNVKG